MTNRSILSDSLPATIVGERRQMEEVTGVSIEGWTPIKIQSVPYQEPDINHICPQAKTMSLCITEGQPKPC